MKKRDLRVELGERSYPIEIERGIIDRIGPELDELGFSGKVAVVTNPTVGDLYADRVVRSLTDAGLTPTLVTVPDGEEYKTLEVASTIYDQLIEAKAERTTPVVALGGGVIGDMAGFVAATYLRGVPYIQVPTTLLAQVDSSVGGKTAVNHPRGKNLIGAFYQPRAVFIDPEALETLDERELRAGFSEVVKYGVIWDEGFFRFLEEDPEGLVALGDRVVDAVARSCEIKAEVVSRDEREADLRAVLNFGHTFGHAIEALTGYTRYRHGEAVAIGMVMAAGYSAQLGLCAREVPRRVEGLVKALGLPTVGPEIPPGEFLEAMRLDKKVSGGKVRIVVVDGRIGRVAVKEAEESALETFLEAASAGAG